MPTGREADRGQIRSGNFPNRKRQQAERHFVGRRGTGHRRV
jgi:hypothetical protein